MFPVKLLLKLMQRTTGKNLLIQTTEIGDSVNITTLLRQLRVSDALLSRTVQPLAECLYIENHTQNLFSKIRLGLRLINRYSLVYFLHPNKSTLFFAAFCDARTSSFSEPIRDAVTISCFISLPAAWLNIGAIR